MDKSNDDLFGEWIRRGVNPDKMSRETIETDRWDREDRARMLKEIPSFSASRQKLQEFANTGEPAMNDMFAVFLKAEPGPLPDDEIAPSCLVNKRIIDQAQDLDVTDRLRRYTVNDDVQSALSCEQIEPDMETLFDMTEQQRQRAQEFEDKLRALALANQEQVDLDDLMDRWASDQGLDPEDCPTCQGTGQVPQDGDGDQGDGADGGDQGDSGQGDGDGSGDGTDGVGGQGSGQGQGSGHGDGGTQPCPDCGGAGQTGGLGAHPGGGSGSSKGRGSKGDLTDEQREQLDKFAKQQEELGKKIEEARKEAEAAGQDFDASMDQVRAQMRGQIERMLDKAVDSAQEQNETVLAWGMDPGTFQRLPAQERIDLAKRMNNEKFRRVAKLFGPMKNMMLSEQQRKVVHTKEEVYDVGIGSDLGRVLPQEIINLRPGPTRLDFLRRFTEGKLLQYELQGQERLAKGAIIICEDGSGSMRGERELWAKAFMLCLLHLARQQKRAFHLIHFGGPGAYKQIDFVKPEDFTMENILDAAELFLNGGTDFATPMRRSLEILDAEWKATGRTKADVVFVTDDECWVAEDFMKQYLDDMHRMGSTTWGISVSGADRREGALNSMTEGKIATIKDLVSGNDVRDIFRGV